MSNDTEIRMERFIENLITRYSAMRGDFVDENLHQVRLLFKRLRPCKKARDQEFSRLLVADVKFQTEALKELKAFEEIARASESILNTAKICVKNHLVRIKFRYDFLMLMTVAMTIGIACVTNYMEGVEAKLHLLVFVVGIFLVIFERLVVLEKISVYEEVANLIDARMFEIRMAK